MTKTGPLGARPVRSPGAEPLRPEVQARSVPSSSHAQDVLVASGEGTALSPEAAVRALRRLAVALEGLAPLAQEPAPAREVLARFKR